MSDTGELLGFMLSPPDCQPPAFSISNKHFTFLQNIPQGQTAGHVGCPFLFSWSNSKIFTGLLSGVGQSCLAAVLTYALELLLAVTGLQGDCEPRVAPWSCKRPWAIDWTMLSGWSPSKLTDGVQSSCLSSASPCDGLREITRQKTGYKTSWV